MRELSRNLDIKKKEFQKSQTEARMKEHLRLHEEATNSKNKIRRNLGASSHLHVENFISGIRFDIIGLCVLSLIIIGECFYLYKQGIIISPMQKGRYEVAVSTSNDNNRNIENAVNRIAQEIKERRENPSLEQLFNTSNPEKIKSFLKETNSMDVKTIIYAKSEKCYYASALTDKDRNVSFKLNMLAGDCRISSIDIED